MKIVFENGTKFAMASRSVQRNYADSSRQWKGIDLVSDVESAKAAFVDDEVYYKQWESIATDDDGNEVTETCTEDLSAWCVAGEIVDHRDGTITVYMGKKTELEQL